MSSVCWVVPTKARVKRLTFLWIQRLFRGLRASVSQCVVVAFKFSVPRPQFLHRAKIHLF